MAPALSSGPSFVDPDLVNEELFHRQLRVPKVCAKTPGEPTTSSGGCHHEMSDCDAKVVLVRVKGADHCLKATPTCPNSLEGKSGSSLRDLLVRFFAASE